MNVVAKRGLAGNGIHAGIRLQVGILLAQGVEGGLGNLFRLRSVAVKGQQQKGGIRTLHANGPAGLVFFALQAPVFRIAKADAVFLEGQAH